MFSPIVPKELNFEKFYKNVWKLNFSYDISRKVDEMRRAMHEIGLSAPGFFKNLLKNIANPFYQKEYEYSASGSFRFKIPYDNFGNSLKEIFINHFGDTEVSSFPLYGAPNFQESTYITTLVYINGRPLTDEKFIVVRQYTVDIVIIPTKYLKDKDNVYIEQRRHWNKPAYHKVDKTAFVDYEYTFDGAGLGTFYSADNGYVQQTKTTFCPSASKGNKFLNVGDYIVFFKATEKSIENDNFDDESIISPNVNSSSSWKILPREMYSISKVIDPNKETTLLKLSFNKDAKKVIKTKEFSPVFNSEKEVESEITFFGGIYPEICKFIESNDFIIENNSAQWEIKIDPLEKPDPYSYSAIGTSGLDTVSMDITDGLIAYYPIKDDYRDYSVKGNHVNLESSLIPTIKVDKIEDEEVSAGYFNGNSFLFVNDSKSLHVNREALTFSLWIKPENHTSANGYLMLLSKYQDGKSFRPWSFYFNATSVTDTSTGNPEIINVVRLDDAVEGDNTTVVVSKIPEAGKWSHVAFTCKKNVETNRLTLEVFINGESVGKAENLVDRYEDDEDEESHLTIGCDRHGVNEFFKGHMRQVRIYKKVLEADEINYIMEIDKKNKINTGIVKLAEKSHFNYIPLLIKQEKVDEAIVTKDHVAIVAGMDEETKAQYLRNVREIDHEEYDTRDFRDIRPFSEEYNTTEESEMIPLPVSLAEELIILVNENTVAQEETDEEINMISAYKANYMAAHTAAHTIRENKLSEINNDCETKILLAIDAYMNEMKVLFENAFDKTIWLNENILNVRVDNDNNLNFIMYGPKYYEIVREVTSQYSSEGFNTKWSDGEVYGQKVSIYTLVMSDDAFNTYLYENGTSREEVAFLNYRGWYYSEETSDFEYFETKDETLKSEATAYLSDRSRWYKLVPYVDYCINEVDGRPPAIRFFKHLKNSTSVRIIKIEPKNWFFFDGFFNTLNDNGIVILDKYSDFPIDKSYLDCTINNQNVEKSLITNIADKAIHINAFDSTNLAYFRFAVPKNIDTWHFIDMYESYKTDLEKFFDSIGMYNDPTDVDEKYEINGMKGLQFRVHPTISPSVYDYPTRFSIYQDDMIYGFVKAPNYRVVRYCKDGGCEYNDFNSNNYIGKHLEHDSDWVYNEQRDAAEITEYLHFFRLKDNTHRIPASEFRIVMEEESKEYNELYADCFRTTDSDGQYAIMNENPSDEGYDVASSLLYIRTDNDGNDVMVFASTNLDTYHSKREYATEIVNPMADEMLSNDEMPYVISKEFMKEISEDRIELLMPKISGTNFLNGGYDPKDLYDYANSANVITRFIDDETTKLDENALGGIDIRPFSWNIHNSVYTTEEDKKFGSRSIVFVGGYLEDGKKVYSYIDTDLKNLCKSENYFNFSEENDGLLSIAFWIKPDCSRKGTKMGLVSDNGENFMIWIDEEGYLNCKCTLDDGYGISNSVEMRTVVTNLFNNKWNHCLFQIKDFGLKGKKVILAVNGEGVAQSVEQDENILYISFFQSDKFCIGKGIENVDAESYIGLLDSFEIHQIHVNEADGDRFFSEFYLDQDIVGLSRYTVPSSDLSELNKEEKLRFWSIINTTDPEWADIEAQVVYRPNFNYGNVISRNIRIIENEFYEKGKYPLEVPALYFIAKSSEIS